ncbi:MAG: FAD-binding and (Fe-S)-binding domain-containing protein [Candidatus Sericytochromatia bacterium]
MSVTAEHHALAEALRQRVQGEVRFDATSRWLYSTDASIYQIQPAGVVIPRSYDDLDATLAVVRAHGGSLVPRGGGTSLGGQALGPGVQLDLSPHFNRILEINAEAGWVRVQPGVVLDQLNQALAPLGYWFGPDVATSSRATLGGMIANNSAGARSLVYGKTGDHVLSLDVLLADGSQAVLRELDPRTWALKARQNSLEGRLCNAIDQMVAAHGSEIRARFPRILRRVSGYNLDEFLDPSQPRSLASLLVGSEGTLGLIREAKLKIVPKPAHRGLLVLYFDSIGAALEANHAMLETGPSAAELLDNMLLELTRQSLAFSRKLYFMEHDAQVLLLVEYQADSALELQHLLENGQRFARSQGFGHNSSLAVDPRVQADVWAIRKAGLPLLYSKPGDRKPITFVEDTAVAPERLQDFIREFDLLVKAHHTEAAYYAHASVGCLHIRPLIDLKQADEVRKMRALAEDVVELVQRYDGAMSGEHGDGRARSEFNERLFGPTVYGLFCQLKALADPQQLFNPGNITDAAPMDTQLRFGGDYTPQPFATALAYTHQESFQTLVELCNGCGACRKTSGTMCPTYMASRDENDTTRARANGLRRLLVEPDLNGQDERELKQLLDLCVGCKGCKAECPSKVDMAKLKSEFTHRWHGRHGVPLRSRLLAEVKWVNHFGSLTAPVSNRLLRFKPLRQLMERGLGLSAETDLPPFAAIPFGEQWRLRAPRNTPSPSQRQIVFWNDCYTHYNHPEVGRAMIALLEAADYQVVVPPQVCCGRPALSLGLLERARSQARQTLETLKPYLDAGLSVVGAEPSCLLSFRDEYPDLWPETSQALARQSLTLPEWLLRETDQGLRLPLQPLSQGLYMHEHCHQKALVGPETTAAVLQLLPNTPVRLGSAGCCGMAGSFGYEREHTRLSHQIADLKLTPEIAAHPDALLVSHGVSCRQQIGRISQRPVLHLAEVFAHSLHKV